ncbi:hypothetical protein BC936DRAFT_145643, partial [Jimgerdemannia flammicorona]
MKFFTLVAVAALAFVSTTTAVPAPPKGKFAAGCDEFYKVVAGDSCSSVAKAAHITPAKLQTYNLGLHKNCDNLDVNSYVCTHNSNDKSNVEGKHDGHIKPHGRHTKPHGRHTKPHGALKKLKKVKKVAKKAAPKKAAPKKPTPKPTTKGGFCKFPQYNKGAFN